MLMTYVTTALFRDFAPRLEAPTFGAIIGLIEFLEAPALHLGRHASLPDDKTAKWQLTRGW